MSESLTRHIRDIADFPKPGIVFRDITPLLAAPGSLALSIELLANPFRGKNIDLVVGAESRGFIFGAAATANGTPCESSMKSPPAQTSRPADGEASRLTGLSSPTRR